MLHDDGGSRWVRGAVGAVYLVFAIANGLMLTGTARVVMTVLDLGTVAVMTWAALYRWRSEIPTFVPVLVSVAQVAATGQLYYSITLMLTFLVIGAAIRSRVIAVSAVLAGGVGWVVAVALREQLRGPELGYYGVQLIFSALLGGLLHEAIRRRQLELATVVERFERLFDATPAGVAIADGAGRVVAANPAFGVLVGRTTDEVVGSEVAPYLGAEGRMPVVRPDGETRWAYLTVGSSDVAGQPWTLIQLQDITDRHLAEEAVRDSDRLLAAVAAAARRIRSGEDVRSTIVGAIRELAAADSVALLEPVPGQAGELVVTHAAGVSVTGTRVPLDGTSMIAHVYRGGETVFLADADRDPRVSLTLLRLVESRSMLWRPVTVHGTVVAVLAVGWRHRVDSVGDHRTLAVDLLADETALALEHERLLRRLELMAFTDSLTGLPNRRAWQESVDRMLIAARATGAPLTVAIADLDHFKRYNDTYGHAAGDELLRRSAAAFAGALRDGDFLARWGGEEFVVALPAGGVSEAAAVLDRLRAAVPDGQTCSVGVATWNTTESVDQLLQRADEALYAAKRAGRNRIHHCDVVLTS